MNATNFIKEVKAAVSGKWTKTKKAKPKKIYKTAEEVYLEELNNN